LRGALQFSAVSIGAAIADSLSVGIAYDNDNVRVLACHCIGALRVSGLAPRVEELLRNPQPAVRETAVQTLARLGHYRALPAMVTLLDDMAPTVRDAAQEALCHMEAERVTDALLGREP